MIRSVFLFLLMTWIPAIPGNTQPAESWGLEECIRYGLEHSYAKQADKLEARKREATRKRETSSFYPRIDAYADYFLYTNDLPTYIFPQDAGSILSGGQSDGPYPLELGLPQNANLGLRIDQVIYDHNFFLADEFSRQIGEVDRLRQKATDENIVFDISQAWYQLSAVGVKKELIRYNLERLDRIEKMLDVQIANGFAREIEKGKIELGRSALHQNLNQAETGEARLRQYLKFLMGMPVDSTLTVQLDTADLQPGLAPDSLKPETTSQVRLLETQMSIQELEQQRTRNEYLPTLNAFGRFRLQAQREAFDFFNGNEDWFLINMFGVRLDVPILQGGKKRREMEVSRIEQETLALQKVRLEESLRMDYMNAGRELDNSLEKVRMEQADLGTARNIYRKTAALFEEGLVMLRELLDAESAFREAEIDLITARYEYKIAELRYLKATGNLLNYTEAY